MDLQHRSELRNAIFFREPEYISNILKKTGLSINSTIGGTTPLQDAAQSGRIAIVRTILRHGPELGPVGENQRTALHYATNKEVVQELLDAQVPPSTVDKNGHTPLMCILLWNLEGPYTIDQRYVVARNSDHLRRGAFHALLPHVRDSLDIRDHEGRTALHHAVEMDLSEETYCLLKEGADFMIPDKNGMKPIDLLSRWTPSGVRTILEVRG